MSRLEIKDSIIDNLEKVDEAMLLAVQRLLDTYLDAQVKKEDPYPEDFDIHGKQLNRNDIIEEMEVTNDKIEAGKEENIPLRDVQNKIGKWLKASE